MADELDAQQDVKAAFNEATQGIEVVTVPNPGPGNSNLDWEQCIKQGFVDGKMRISVA